MKFIHLSDLHLGKRLYEFSMLEDQEHILKEILTIIDSETPDGVMIAGDVYDKPVPPAEAVTLFDSFLVSLAKRRLEVFVISGNHDSPERIAFGSRIMDAAGIHLSPVYSGKVEPVTLTDSFGEVNVWMLPFVKPAHVRRFFPEEEIASYTDALGCAVSNMDIDSSKRNLLITHQFVTGSQRSESEELSVGGTDNVDASVFEPFDYVALGHLHVPQDCIENRIRYCGTPLAYSFSEAGTDKSVTVVELGAKGDVSIRKLKLTPRHKLVEFTGTYEQVMQRSYYEGTTWQEDYVRVILKDEEDIPDGMAKLRTVYHNIMTLDYDNKRTSASQSITGAKNVREKTPLEHFSELFELQNNQPMTDEQTAFVSGLIEKIWEGER